MLKKAKAAARLPANDRDRARTFFKFEDCDLPGLKTVDGIAHIVGNFAGERRALFRGSEANLLAMGQPVR